MTSPRSMFTEAIEDHLALKKQNSHLEASLPINRFDVGDPLDRYPGGPVRPATGLDDSPAAELAAGVASSTAASPAETPDAREGIDTANATASVVEGEFRRPLEPLGAMTPMLSLVEDLDEDDELAGHQPMVDPGTGATTPATGVSTATAANPDAGGATMVLSAEFGTEAQGSVVRFPGGAGPRDEQLPLAEELAEQPTGEQPVIVIDADEPLAPLSSPVVPEPRGGARGRRPSFFNLRRKKKQEEPVEGSGWFAQAPRDFDWD